VRAAHRANQLVEFELDGVAIAILEPAFGARSSIDASRLA